MINLFANIIYFIIKPVISAVLIKKNYPEDAIIAKYAQSPSDIIFTKDDDVIMFHAVSVGEINAIENLVKKQGKNSQEKKYLLQQELIQDKI